VRLLLGQFAPESLARSVQLFLQPAAQRVDYARQTLEGHLMRTVADRRHRFELAAGALASYSPHSILARGYALVTREPEGSVVHSSTQVKRGDSLHIRLAKGAARARVEETHAG
jgi:exodeoxyribonuclease VII large subunit